MALGTALDFVEASGYYGLFAFLPIVVLPALHLPPAQLPLFYLAGSVCALVGGLAAAALLDRLGRGWTVGGFYLATALGLVAFSSFTSRGAGPIMIGFALVNMLATGSWIAAYPTFSELFPTALRATGIGASVAAGRIGAALSGPGMMLLVLSLSCPIVMMPVGTLKPGMAIFILKNAIAPVVARSGDAFMRVIWEFKKSIY
ncbi:hypothetical protein [Acidocella sp.]|uniref:hypothetical protein n=1 Tax=Acidocella sp. TaxID=50710 RepID=UPI0025C54366|nr:hypothetical protein [Acidocella sp.]